MVIKPAGLGQIRVLHRLVWLQDHFFLHGFIQIRFIYFRPIFYKPDGVGAIFHPILFLHESGF
jgi:hypothetical protein